MLMRQCLGESLTLTSQPKGADLQSSAALLNQSALSQLICKQIEAPVL